MGKSRAMGEQRKSDVDDVRKSSGSLHSGKQVRDPSNIRVAVYSCTAADYEENHKELYLFCINSKKCDANTEISARLFCSYTNERRTKTKMRGR